MNNILKIIIISSSLISSVPASEWVELSQEEVTEILKPVNHIEKKSPSKKIKIFVSTIKSSVNSILPKNICCKLGWKNIKVEYTIKY